MREIWLIAVLGACGSVEKTSDMFTIATDGSGAFVRRGETQMIGVTVTRTAGDADVEVTIAALPDGVTADPLTLPSDTPTGMLVLHASATATEGVAMIAVHGAGGEVDASAPPVRLLVGGAPGSLDESFGTGGKFVANVPGMVVVGRALVLSAGGVVVTGSTSEQQVTVKLTEAGELDPTFGSNGLISTGSGSFSEGIAIANTPDNQLVIAGIGNGTQDFSDFDFGAFRYSQDGVLDTTFGASGVATFSPGTGPAEVHSTAIAPDGAVFLAGTFFGNPLTTRVVKLTPGGIVDPTYNAPAESGVNVQSCVLQPDGKLVIAGGAASDFFLARYNPDGSRDTGFGMGGIVRTTFTAGATTNAFALVPVAGGKLVAAGIDSTHIVMARYNANGSLDLAFGVGGKISTTIAFDTFGPNAALIDDQNRLVMVGVTNGLPSIARVGADGMADATFGTNGIAAVDFGITGTTNHTGGFGVVVDPDGRILFTGEVGPAGSAPNGEHMIVARLWP